MINVNEGELIVMPVNVPTMCRAVERFKLLLIMIRSADPGAGV